MDKNYFNEEYFKKFDINNSYDKVNDIKYKKGIAYQKGREKGVKVTNQADTSIKGEDKKIGNGSYVEKLQMINDRIRSFRPSSISNYKPIGTYELLHQDDELYLWDFKTWDFGEYPEFLTKKGISWPTGITQGSKEEYPYLFKEVEAQLFMDFKTLVKSAAVLRGYNQPSKVRGGTYPDVDDFFNFSTIKLCERRLKQYDLSSTCRLWQNWPAYLSISLPQYLIEYNKSKIDYDVETYWPMVKDDKTGSYKKKDFEVEVKFSSRLFTRNEFFTLFDQILETIPESKGLELDIILNMLYGLSLTEKNLVSEIVSILKIQLYEFQEELKW